MVDRTKSWTKDEIDILKNNAKLSSTQLKKLLNRSVAAIIQKRNSLGLVKEPKWTKEIIIKHQ